MSPCDTVPVRVSTSLATENRTSSDPKTCAASIPRPSVCPAIGPNGPTDTQVLLFNPELNQPNDVAQAPNGDIYFTDPDFDGKNKTSAVHLLTANGQSRKVIEDKIGRAHV